MDHMRILGSQLSLAKQSNLKELKNTLTSWSQ